MHTRISLQRWMATLALILTFWEVPAHAYLDPGTGSLVAQAIIAAIAGAAFVLRSYWAKIRDLTRSLLARDDQGNSQ